MNADFRVVNLFFDPTGRPFGLPDDPCTNLPIEFLLFADNLLVILVFLFMRFFLLLIECIRKFVFCVAPDLEEW
jgi:hypothetical protein